MEKLYSETIGLEVSTEYGSFISQVFDVVVDPDNGKIIGFLLAPRGKKILSPSDVLHWNRQLILNDPEEIVDIDEILKAKEVLKRNIPILHNKVFTENGTFLGKVVDFAMHPKFFMLTKLIVAKSLFRIISYEEIVISYKNILEINRNSITVKDVEGKIPTKSIQPAENSLSVDITPS